MTIHYNLAVVRAFQRESLDCGVDWFHGAERREDY